MEAKANIEGIGLVQKVLPIQLLITGLFLQMCDLLITVNVLRLGVTEGNPIIGGNPDTLELIAFKLMAVFFIVWLATTEKGCKGLLFLNIIYGLVVLYSLAGMTII